MDPIQARLAELARDGDLDVEDIDAAVAAALADGTLSAMERDTFRAALLLYAGVLEPGAAALLAARAAGDDSAAPNRVLLAPHPRSAAPDLYQPRTEVVALQEALGRVGHATGIDGDYGPGTLRAVQGFQAAAGLPPTGAVDSRTLAALNARLAAVGQPLLDLTPRDRIRPDAVIGARGSGDPAAVRALQEALTTLADRYARPSWKARRDGRFTADTERAVQVFQADAWLPATGLYDTSTRDALNEGLRRAGLPLLTAAPAPPGTAGVELHFYPGEAERKLYVRRGGETLAVYPMVGGRREAAPDPTNPHVAYDPTPSGAYEVVELSPHTSSVWAWSYVPYGAHLRESGGEVQFRDGRGRWQYATGPQGVFRGRTPEPLTRADYLDGRGRLPAVWRANDFGHLRARLRDLRTGRLVTHMVHAGPGNERTDRYYADTRAWLDAGVAVAELGYSHGCEHVHPRDLDQMVARGWLAPGARFVVHGYDERAASGSVIA